MLTFILSLVFAPGTTATAHKNTEGIALIRNYSVNSSLNQTDVVHGLRESYSSVCHRALGDFRSVSSEWNHNAICKNWIRFRDVGNFSDEDFQMRRPRHLTATKKGWIEDSHHDYLSIPEDYCLFETTGWFTATGALFDCSRQYPLLMKRDRRDLDLTISEAAGRELIAGQSHETPAALNDSLFSVVFPFNDAFSHSFSTGVSLLVHALRHMQYDPAARLLVPANGPFLSLLTALGVPAFRLVVAGGKRDTYFSPRATLILRRPPFNIVQAHWPAHALSDMRNITVAWLKKHGHVKPLPHNLVVYLWRTGVRGVADQEGLVDKIRKSLRSGVELVVEGRSSKISYNSAEAHSHWISTADLFVRAAAVIGPHGGAFGNAFLCAWNTTLIEFNVEWTPHTADGDAGNNQVRDLFYSMARGVGNVHHFWSVWPEQQHSGGDFYQRPSMRISADEVVEILRREGLAQ